MSASEVKETCLNFFYKEAKSKATDISSSQELWFAAFDMCDHRYTVLHKNDLSNKVQDLKTTIDMLGSRYHSLSVKWEYNKDYVDISTPGYITRLLGKYSTLESVPPSIFTTKTHQA